MSVAPVFPPGEPMSWEEYSRRPSSPPSEYIDGRLVMMGAPSRRHQEACLRMLDALRNIELAGYVVTLGWVWKIGRDEFVPDVMVHPVTDEDVRFTGKPLLVVEILSSDRRNDLVLKSMRYARGGAENYWTLDPRDRAIDAYVLDEDGLYVQAAHADENTGPVDFSLAGRVFTADVLSLLT